MHLIFTNPYLGGEFATFQRFEDTPGCENVPAHEGEKLCMLLYQ